MTAPPYLGSDLKSGSRRPTAVELFVGAGGLGLGVEQAGFRHLAAVDWDQRACETLRRNQEGGFRPISEWPLHEADVAQFDFSTIGEEVHLVSGGPPCQPFSLGGRHQAFLDPRDMFPQAIRAVRELKPHAFLFENVKGLTRTAFSSYLDYIRLQLCHPEIMARPEEPWLDHLKRLRDHAASGSGGGLCYHVFMKVLNAADYGVPQSRHRIFIVGFRADRGIENFLFPEPSHTRDALLWSQWRSGDYWDHHHIAKRQRPDGGAGEVRAARLKVRPESSRWQTVHDAICDLPDPELQPDADPVFDDHRFQPGAKIYPGHTGSPLHEPAKTLKAGVHGVPGGENMLRRPDGSVRYFTIREAARLQTFPDEMRFHGSWNHVMRQLGNAVPCTLARKVATCVLDHLMDTQRHSEQSSRQDILTADGKVSLGAECGSSLTAASGS